MAAVAAAIVLHAACSLVRRDARPPAVVLSRAPDAARVGSSTCLGCHEAAKLGIAGTVHAHLTLDGHPGGELCESCHGPGGSHAASMDPADIVTGADLAGAGNEARSGMCLSCHETMAVRWPRSPHSSREVSCWSCHPDALHAGVEVEGAVTPAASVPGGDRGRFCLQCHPEVEQQLVLQVGHPVTEGGMTCTSCHGPHGEDGTVESGDAEAACTSCHVETAGPWIYEHDAMREGCTSCHEPHGSANPKLLVMTGNALCLQCHVEIAYPEVGAVDHAAYLGSGAECYQCHLEVHGSNASQILAPGW
jgi:DmsE family decaheme c-type cytochrome